MNWQLFYAARLVQAPAEPAHISGLNAEIVAEKTPNPDRGGHLILGYAHAFAFEVGRHLDAGVRAHPDAGLAKLARREDRNREYSVIAARPTQKIARQRHLRGVEFGVARHPPEHFLWIHA